MNEIMTSLSETESQRKRSLLETFPAELLLYIFDLVADHYDPTRQEPSIDVGNRSPWSKDLRLKKALVRVCKTWRAVATPFLYLRIYLYRVGQLVALVKVLEESAVGHDDVGYGSLVHHIHGRFYVHPTWEAVYLKSVVRLLALCTSIRSFSWKILWSGPEDAPVSVSCSTVNVMLLIQPSFRPFLISLQKLELSLDRPYDQETLLMIDRTPILILENLEELSFEAREPVLLEGFEFFSERFFLPKLHRLSINLVSWPRDHLSNLEVSAVFILLGSFGARLSSLTLNTPQISTKIATRSLSDILRYTPNLRTLTCSCQVFQPIDTASSNTTPFPNLQKLALFTPWGAISPVSPLDTMQRNCLEGFLLMASSRALFPALEAVTILDNSFPAVPMDGATPPSCHDVVYSYLFAWSGRFHEMGIALLGVGDELVAPANPESGRWSGRNATDDEIDEEEGPVHTDPEDLSYDSDDVSFHDESSEYSSWDSEPDDGDSDLEQSAGGGHRIDSAEALEIFERTVEVRRFFD